MGCNKSSSKREVYNNTIVPQETNKQKKKIEQTMLKNKKNVEGKKS